MSLTGNILPSNVGNNNNNNNNNNGLLTLLAAVQASNNNNNNNISSPLIPTSLGSSFLNSHFSAQTSLANEQFSSSIPAMTSPMPSSSDSLTQMLGLMNALNNNNTNMSNNNIPNNINNNNNISSIFNSSTTPAIGTNSNLLPLLLPLLQAALANQQHQSLPHPQPSIPFTALDLSTQSRSGSAQTSPNLSISPNENQIDGIGIRDKAPPKYARAHQCPDCEFETREPRDFLHHRRDVHGSNKSIHYCRLCPYASQQHAKVIRHEMLIHAVGTKDQSHALKYMQPMDAAPKLVDTTNKVDVQSVSILPTADAKKIRRRQHGPRSTSSQEKTPKSAGPKRYLSEFEAILSPSEESDMQMLAGDPDIEARKCSVCGYQGKWMSEMIRHKRVHTAERPFRCKYCSRTSKWKADLIRHVNKVHGIRVVSKYTRSKTFDSDPSVMRALKQQHGFRAVSHVNNTTGSSGSMASSPVDGPPNLLEDDVFMSNDNDVQIGGVAMKVYRCRMCGFESSNETAVCDHLHNVHDSQPHACTACNVQFTELESALTHCREVHANETLVTSQILIMDAEEMQHELSASPSLAISTDQNDMDSNDGQPISPALTIPASGEALSCGQCPFTTDSIQLMTDHAKSHETE